MLKVLCVFLSKYTCNSSHYVDLFRDTACCRSSQQFFHLGWSANEIPVSMFVIMALSLTAGAYLTEIIRSGILAMDTGQVEAAYSIGLTYSQTFRRVILPQALKVSIPNFTNLGIGFAYHLYRGYSGCPRDYRDGDYRCF